MNFENSVSPGVSAFVAKMRVRAAQSPGAILPGHGHPASLAWRVDPLLLTRVRHAGYR